MTKNSKRKFLLITVFLSVLLSCSAYGSLIPNAPAAELTIQQKGLTILSNVVGLDLAKYNVTTTEYQPNVQASYLGVVPQTNVGYDLTSADNKLKLLFTFANGNVQMMQVLESKGAPILTKPLPSSNTRKMAIDFLNNYQMYTGNPLYGQLKSTLINLDASKNLTKTIGNIILEVVANNNNGYTNFKWYYSSSGAIAPYSKFVALIYKEGFLACFVDNWQFYNVGSTSVNLSEEEAITIALKAAKAHSWSLKLENDALDVKNFNESNVRWTSLLFDNSLNANKMRSDDALELYPVWRVGIALNKWYGHMYGIQVDIWADTKEVRNVQEAWSTFPPPEGAPIANISTVEELTNQISDNNSTTTSNNQASVVAKAEPNLTMWIALPSAVAVTGTYVVWVLRKKNSNSSNLLKPRSLKTGGILLCVLILSIIVLAPIATANATRVGIVWGSESNAAIDPSTYQSWRKTQTEIYWQRLTAANISLWFGANGYNGINHQGNVGPSTESQILIDLSNLQYQDYLAVVDFDHGVGGFPGQIPGYWQAPSDEFHYMFEDNNGTIWGSPYNQTNHPEHGVYDLDIYLSRSGGATAVFAFINTCLSACISDYVGTYYAAQRWELAQWPYPLRPVGMPLAWTGRLVEDIDTTPGFNLAQDMSDDGYGDPDAGPQVYIGFPKGSASLEQLIPYPNGPNPYYYWVYHFFYYALCNDISVNQALDSASAVFYGQYFGGSPLRTGFYVYWWNMTTPPDWATSTMAVYGNGNIHLKNYVPPPDSVTMRSVNGPTAGDIGTSYQFSASAADSKDHRIQYTFDWGDNSQTVTDWLPNYATATASHSWGSQGIFSVKVKAECENGEWSSWSNPFNVNMEYPCMLVVRGANNAICHRTYDSSNGWSDWNALPDGTTCDGPASAVCAGKQYFVVRSTDGQSLWLSSVDLATQAFSGWSQLSGATESAPALVSKGTNLFLVVRGLTNAIWYRTYDCVTSSWGDWTELSGATCDGPVAAMLGNNLHIVIRGFSSTDVTENNTMYHIIVQPNVGVVRDWITLSGATPSKPALTASQVAYQLCLVVRGMTNNIYWATYDGLTDSWGSWNAVPYGSTCDGPAATVCGNELHMVVRNMDGSTLYHGHIDLATNAFSGWTLLSGSTPSPPVFASTPEIKFYQLTVDAYDPYFENELHPNVYIDDREAGTAPISVLVAEGWHSVWVDDPVWNDNYNGYYDLEYFTDYYGNGANRPIYSDTWITAVYRPRQ